MKDNVLKKAVELSQKGCLCVASPEEKEAPMVAIIGRLDFLSKQSVAISGSFNDEVRDILKKTRKVLIEIWDGNEIFAIQMGGAIKDIKDKGVRRPRASGRTAVFPKEGKRRIIVEIRRISEFRHVSCREFDR